MNVEQIFSSPAADPMAILHRREARAARRRELLQTGCQSLVSFTLNIPGAVKQFPLAHAAFAEGLAQLRLFFGPRILLEETVELITGSEAFLTLSLPAEAAKETAVSIEMLHPLGRLFDMDVLDPDGRTLSRAAFSLPRRKCLVCGRDAKLCSRAQAHSPEELRERVAALLDGYFRDQAAQRCAVQASRALLTEVSATPKPGLVDRANSGSHRDMDFFTFLDSGSALAPWFGRMFCAGWDHAELPPARLFAALRFVGRQAEDAMLRVTGGVNTHKGLIFSLGLLCGAMGAAQAAWNGPPPLKTVLRLCGEMGKCACQDFEHAPAETNGLTCYRTYRITGVRGEAADGFPSAVGIGLPSLRKLCASGRNLNDAAVITLLRLLANVTDTNMLKRGGFAAAESRRRQAKALLSHAERADFLDTLSELDRQYIQDNLSPGGCADLLSISLMLFFSSQSGLFS